MTHSTVSSANTQQMYWILDLAYRQKYTHKTDWNIYIYVCVYVCVLVCVYVCECVSMSVMYECEF